MSIDTAEKRRMAAGVPFGWGVTPNSAQDEEWRAQVAGSYLVIVEQVASFATLSTPVGGTRFTMPVTRKPVTRVPRQFIPPDRRPRRW